MNTLRNVIIALIYAFFPALYMNIVFDLINNQSISLLNISITGFYSVYFCLIFMYGVLALYLFLIFAWDYSENTLISIVGLSLSLLYLLLVILPPEITESLLQLNFISHIAGHLPVTNLFIPTLLFFASLIKIIALYLRKCLKPSWRIVPDDWEINSNK